MSALVVTMRLAQWRMISYRGFGPIRSWAAFGHIVPKTASSEKSNFSSTPAAAAARRGPACTPDRRGGSPRLGGVLLAVIGADPPSFDPHQENTFATIQLVAPLYSTLLQIDPYSYRRSSATSLASG